MSREKDIRKVAISIEEFADQLIKAAKAEAEKPENNEVVRLLGGKAKAAAFLLSSCHDKSFTEIKP